eukprot:CAMPEP_0177727394 /NCGR_PEP_ID=MMETSP0484_2-20121128/20297_1 /TAXON_ID=354590 /ORGANISM="Rhodomonas lens, Strain RHODO" /LENGTH=187 /DNA_ID=CAMNT_0019240043 /DNA_START=78 /DNA_END=638 /DNA_ORIENTATION=-
MNTSGLSAQEPIQQYNIAQSEEDVSDRSMNEESDEGEAGREVAFAGRSFGELQEGESNERWSGGNSEMTDESGEGGESEAPGGAEGGAAEEAGADSVQVIRCYQCQAEDRFTQGQDLNCRSCGSDFVEIVTVDEDEEAGTRDDTFVSEGQILRSMMLNRPLAHLNREDRAARFQTLPDMLMASALME